MRRNITFSDEAVLAMRLGTGLLFFLGGLILGGVVVRSGNAFAFVFAAVLFLVAGLLWVGPITSFLAEPVGNLFFPKDRFDRPQPLYSLAEAQERRREFEQAMATYAGIAESFPDETRPWIGMLEIAIRDLHDPERAQQLYERGIAELTTPEARETLAVMYRGIRSTGDAKPEWGRERTVTYRHQPRPPLAPR
jgi:hypothetical protein